MISSGKMSPKSKVKIIQIFLFFRTFISACNYTYISIITSDKVYIITPCKQGPCLLLLIPVPSRQWKLTIWLSNECTIEWRKGYSTILCGFYTNSPHSCKQCIFQTLLMLPTWTEACFLPGPWQPYSILLHLKWE